MDVLGVGLPRTGTLSQKAALEMLGISPCYHMVDVLADLGRAEGWLQALDGSARWEDVLGGFQSTVDWPGAFFYRELMERYPEAKVVLSVRDSTDWARSMAETVGAVLFGDTMLHDLSSARCRIDTKWQRFILMCTQLWERSGFPVGAEAHDPTALVAAMERVLAEVRASVPADRLLEWSVAAGWEPLCAFLGLPVPDAPFPRLNDAATFADRIVLGALASITAWQAGRAPSPVPA